MPHRSILQFQSSQSYELIRTELIRTPLNRKFIILLRNAELRCRSN